MSNMQLRGVRQSPSAPLVASTVDVRLSRIVLASLIIALLAMMSGCAISPRANEGKTVVIAGASSGFGKGVALELANQRANLVLAARRTEILEELARECEQRGAKTLER